MMVGLLAACETPEVPGFLQVKAPQSGQYEIYRLTSETPLQLVSEQSGHFNEKVPLPPGSYLVLADCSSETVIIYPGETQELTAHRLRFLTPIEPDRDDRFHVQCNRADKTKSRQNIVDQYEFDVLQGRRDLLVGMVPMTVELVDGEPTVREFPLSAVQVAEAKEERAGQPSFFVSAAHGLISVTQSQLFGNWAFLLPGEYILEVNGTEAPVTLSTRETRIVHPAYVRVEASPGIDLEQAARIKGTPDLVEVGVDHWLNFNQTYPVLPGKTTLTLSGSSRSMPLELAEGETKVLEVRSVTVHLDCSPWEWTCLGRKEVALYVGDRPYPFVESVTDAPILYFEDEKPVWLQVDGSRDIRYQLPKTKRDKDVRLGFVNLIPVPTLRAGQHTDLVRVEAAKLPTEGVTLDVDLEEPTLMPLVAGWYHLAQFVTLSQGEGVRDKAVRGFKVPAGDTVDLEFKVYLSEKRYAAWKKKDAARQEKRRAEKSQEETLRKRKAL